jgi:hypothetical protein
MRLAPIILAATILLAAAFLAACDSNTSNTQGVSSTVTNVVARPAAERPALETLLGQWVRPDGGYVLELKSVDAGGRFAAAYLNPAPIHVEQAHGEGGGDVLRLEVVLRDTNYPGCIYRLTYDAKADQLSGTYFQAALGQTYDVVFVRLRGEIR